MKKSANRFKTASATGLQRPRDGADKPRLTGSLLSGLGLAAVLSASVASAPAHAQPLYANYYKQTYGYTPACMACHRDGGGSPLNAFGEQFKLAGETLAALKAIAEKDADGDGVVNGAEALAKSNPGSKNSTPTDKGNWLDISSLIPKEIQAEFAGIKEYLPRDAFLTDTDISKAKEMGVALSKADDNTIYIPLTDRRPAGTGLIFQAEFEGKPFFLMMTTDRKLQVTKVAPISTKNAAAAEKSTVYSSFVGKTLDQLPATQGTGVDAAITQAVKKAGTLVFVRLKGA